MQWTNEYPIVKEKKYYIYIDVSETRGYVFKKSVNDDEIIGYVVEHQERITSEDIDKIKKELKRLSYDKRRII